MRELDIVTLTRRTNHGNGKQRLTLIEERVPAGLRYRVQRATRHRGRERVSPGRKMRSRADAGALLDEMVVKATIDGWTREGAKVPSATAATAATQPPVIDREDPPAVAAVRPPAFTGPTRLAGGRAIAVPVF